MDILPAKSSSFSYKEESSFHVEMRVRRTDGGQTRHCVVNLFGLTDQKGNHYVWAPIAKDTQEGVVKVAEFKMYSPSDVTRDSASLVEMIASSLGIESKTLLTKLGPVDIYGSVIW
ncbi:MAG: hypothetical protein M3O22_02775 [Pseudomonadota bacterium]|nr:hypothetical protein [Pseudomonadota bacterium]